MSKAVLLSMIGVMGVNAEDVFAPSPTCDWSAIDQGIAYILMMMALLLTYFLH